jgi:transposase-like protein
MRVGAATQTAWHHSFRGNHRVVDMPIAVVDGLPGFPEAINAALPATAVQTCIVHPPRNSMGFASWGIGPAETRGPSRHPPIHDILAI